MSSEAQKPTGQPVVEETEGFETTSRIFLDEFVEFFTVTGAFVEIDKDCVLSAREFGEWGVAPVRMMPNPCVYIE